MPTVSCLDASAFQRLVEGQFAVEELEHFASHLERCNRCTRLVQNLADDKLIALVDSVKRLPAHSAEASHLQTLIQRMLNMRGNVETLDQLAGVSQGGAVAPSVSVPSPTTAPHPAAPSQFIGRYRIVRELGRGGMGTVYQAEDMELRRLVAVKVPQFNGSAEHQTLMRQRFLREARAAAAVEHPYVCKIHDVGEQAGMPFVVMAFVEGPSLAGRMENLRRVNDRSAVALVLRIAEALLAVHAKGIIHRDLKPANILLPKDNTPILTDFGLAHVHAESAQLTGEGALLGTPAYMAPEQAVVELGPVTARTDLYSLAVVLFQLLTGRLPVEGDTMQILAHHVARKPAPPPSQFRPDIDPKLDGILRKALAIRPEDRYADVAAFVQPLKDWARTAQAQARPLANQETAPILPVPQAPTVAHQAVHPTPPMLPGSLPEVLPVSGYPSAPSPPAAVPIGPRRRFKWWHLAASVLLLGGSIALVSIIFRGKKDEPTPDGGQATSGDDKKTKEQPKPEPAGVPIDEDFRKISESQRGLPEDWIGGQSFRVPKVKGGEQAWMELSQPNGEHAVTLPQRLALAGDFYISGEYILMNGYHKLTIRLTGKKDPVLETVIYNAGYVTIAGVRKTLLDGFKPYQRVRFSLTREGKMLRVKLNDKDAGTEKLEEVVVYDSLSIGMFAYGSSHSKLYRLKAGPGAE